MCVMCELCELGGRQRRVRVFEEENRECVLEGGRGGRVCLSGGLGTCGGEGSK